VQVARWGTPERTAGSVLHRHRTAARAAAPRVEAPVTWHVFAPASFEIDRDRLWLDEQTSIGIYGPTRCIIDAFWLRHQEGSEQATIALRRWLVRPSCRWRAHSPTPSRRCVRRWKSFCEQHRPHPYTGSPAREAIPRSSRPTASCRARTSSSPSVARASGSRCT